MPNAKAPKNRKMPNTQGYHKDGTKKQSKELNTSQRRDRKEGANTGHERGYVNPNPAEPKWDPRTGEWVNARGEPVCGAKRSGNSTSGPGTCCNPKGFRTEHPGYGRCLHHGGNSPSGIMAAAKERVMAERPVYGGPLPIGPHEAILNEVQHTAGHVAWLRQMIQLMGTEGTDWQDVVDLDADPSGDGLEVRREGDPRGKGMSRTLTQITPDLRISPSVWIQLYQQERSHLVAVCKAAVSMGVAERAVRIAEDQGQLMAGVIMNIFNDAELGLTFEQRRRLPTIARRHLMAADPALNPRELDRSHAQVHSRQDDDVIDAEVVSED